MFDELLKWHDALDVEEQHYVHEGVQNEGQLAIVDLLAKDQASIPKGDLEKIKQVAVDLMNSVYQRHHAQVRWRRRASAPSKAKPPSIMA